MGFNIARTHDATFVRKAIERAIERTGLLLEWFHSGWGGEYASHNASSWLGSQGVAISRHPKGAPWCHGSQESFFGRFKVEFGGLDPFDSLAVLLEALHQQLHYFTHIKIINRPKMSLLQFREKWEHQREN